MRRTGESPPACQTASRKRRLLARFGRGRHEDTARGRRNGGGRRQDSAASPRAVNAARIGKLPPLHRLPPRAIGRQDPQRLRHQYVGAVLGDQACGAQPAAAGAAIAAKLADDWRVIAVRPSSDPAQGRSADHL